MPISKIQVPSLTTPIDIRNGHSANVTYANENFSAQVNTVNNPYVGLILSLYFPAVLDIESGVKQVSLTFGNSETYTTSFLILGYSYEYVVPVLIQIKSIDNGVLTYDILHKGSVPSSSASINVEIDSQDDTQLNFDTGSNAQSTIVITYPNEDIEGTSYEVYAGGNSECLVPPYTSSDVGKVLTVAEDAEHPKQHTVIPEQTATLEKAAGEAWLYLFDESSGVDTDFFENASVGDKCLISIDGAEYVESTAVAVYDMVLFPVGDYYVGYASTFGGMGVASLAESPKTNITITAYANVKGQLAEWRTGVLIININPYFITPSSDYYPALKAAYDDGAKLFARVIGMSSDIDSHSVGALAAVSYDSANDQFKARISYLQDGSVLYMAVGDVTIFNDNTNFTVSDVCKVQMTRV